jgi:hypothetical protein
MNFHILQKVKNFNNSTASARFSKMSLLHSLIITAVGQIKMPLAALEGQVALHWNRDANFW